MDPRYQKSPQAHRSFYQHVAKCNLQIDRSINQDEFITIFDHRIHPILKATNIVY